METPERIQSSVEVLGRERPVPTFHAVLRAECLVSSVPPAAPPEPERPSRPPLVPSLSLAIRLAIWLRKGVIFVLGLSVLVVGVVMLVTPGPAFVVIPAGLAILATEFYWARRLLQDVRRRIEDRVRQTLGGPTPHSESSDSPHTPSAKG